MTDHAKTRRIVELLLLGYAPFFLMVVGVTGSVAYALGAWAWTVAEQFSFGAGVLLAIPAVIVAGFVFSLLPACLEFFTSAEMGDPWEIRLQAKGMKGLLRLVRDVAERLSLPMPDEVRLHVESVAHVYEEQNDSGTARILVIGGSALASLDRNALAGVIAHELGHFAGGDTALSRRAFRWHRTMLHVELALIERPWNPLGWLLRGYHLGFRLAWAANQRAQEYEADRYFVQRVGEKETARTLIALSAIEEMPWSRLTSVAEWFAIMPSRDVSIFSEQVRRARQVTPSQWQDACRRALQQKTGLFDSHPCLRDRLGAIGISPKPAISVASKLRPGETEPSEFIHGWDAIDAAMSAVLVQLVQSVQQDKRDMAAILLGKPIS